MVLLDALHKAECLEQAAIVGVVLRETAKSQHVSRSLGCWICQLQRLCMLLVCIWLFNLRKHSNLHKLLSAISHVD